MASNVEVDKDDTFLAASPSSQSSTVRRRNSFLEKKMAGKWLKKQKIPSTTSNSSGYATAKASAVVSPGEIGRIVDLGLGRGVDITKRSPWLDKSSFQVRPVDLDNIIGTEEGGSLQNYEHEIVSIQEQQGELKASIAIPQSPVMIGVDAEQSRSHATTRRSVGKKVVNRTISFRADFHDAPKSCTGDPRKAREEASLALGERRSASRGGLMVTPPLTLANEEALLAVQSSPTPCLLDEGNMTFDERLCKWILERVIHRSELRAMQSMMSTDKASPPPSDIPDTTAPIESLGKYIQVCSHEQRKEVVKDCKDFVYHFRITHYVSAIELGAAEYRVMSEDEYKTRVGLGGSFGFEAVANAAVKEKAEWKKTKRASDLKRIGLIKPDGTVERGSYGEAVVGIQVQPISSLVKIRYLQLALQQALLEYSTEKGNKSSGPFIVACNDDGVYLTVNKSQNYAVEGTLDINRASPFHIVPSDGSHPNEFMMVHYTQNASIRAQELRRCSSSLNAYLHMAISPMPRYLKANTSIAGHNHAPLTLEMKIDETCARLVLQSRIISKKHHMVMDTSSWLTGREIYFIRCARRRFKKEGFLCMKYKPSQNGLPPYRLKIASSTDKHDENHFMLFRLLPISLKQQAEPDTAELKEDPQPGDHQEFEKLNLEYRRFSEWRTASRRVK
jgi:hypothetical protein